MSDDILTADTTDATGTVTMGPLGRAYKPERIKNARTMRFNVFENMRPDWVISHVGFCAVRAVGTRGDEIDRDKTENKDYIKCSNL